MSETSRERVARHRATLRKAGLRPVQLWVPDTRSAAFLAEAERQSRRVNESPDAEAVMRWLEDVSEFDAPPDAAG